MNKAASDIQDINTSFPRAGQVHWIGLRPSTDEPMQVVESVDVSTDAGLIGDRFAGKPGAERQVTLIQQEHLVAMGSLMGGAPIDPRLARRNIVVSGVNLSALKGARFSIGTVELLGTGPCAPCSKMEKNLGVGGFNAMRGHGGITASVISGGSIRTGDEVRFLDLQSVND